MNKVKIDVNKLAMIKACLHCYQKDATIARLREAMCCYAREELGNMAIESDEDAIEYFMGFRDSMESTGSRSGQARRIRSTTQRSGSDSERSEICLLYTSPSPRDGLLSRMPSSA